MSPVRAAAVTIDVDSLRHYLDIHGLPAPPPEADPIYTVALPRFFALLERHRIPATLFVIGADAAPHAAAFAPAAGLGCEIASHSHTHDYRLFERDRARIDAELEAAEETLAPLNPDGRVVGFRAPGYNVSPTLLSALVARGYRYDSSLLPSPMYWAARAAAIRRYAWRGRPSASRTGRWRAFAGPLEPYRTTAEAPWRPVEDGPLTELPMLCAPGTRVPIIGTSWVVMPAPARRALLEMALRAVDCVNFEMHGIDLLDPDDPGVPAELVAAQPDLRVPWRDKEAAFDGLFARLRNARTVQTLAEIATQL